MSNLLRYDAISDDHPCMHASMVRLSTLRPFNELLKEVLVARIVLSATLHLARNVAKNRDVPLALVGL